MKIIYSAAVACMLLMPAALVAQTGKVFDNLSFPSKILRSSRKFAIYLPPDYDVSNRSYPVLYLLHGSLDVQTGWVQFGEVLHIADKAIADGTATAMIIVMPDAYTERPGFFNDMKGDWNYEDFFFNELIPYIEKNYRARTEKRFRAVSGLSMGGGGAFIYALHHPEMFVAACPLSADVGPVALEDARKMLSQKDTGIPDSVIANYYQRRSVISLIENMPEGQKKAVRWYIAVGDKDGLSEGNALVHVAMRRKEILHEFRILDGGHNWTFWRASLANVLEFVSDSFHQP